MKKILFLLAFFFIVGVIFLSCSKDKSDKDDPGNISGMGNAEGVLEVDEPLSFPIGLHIKGNITGFKPNSGPLENPVGSGGQYVILDILIQNETNKIVNFYLPGGSVVECQTEGYQHGICINRVDITIEAEKNERYKLLIYCINKGKNGSHPDINYLIKGVSSSDRMKRLVNALEDKKIDIRNYLPDNKSEFEIMCDKIQDVVWAITNGSGLNDDDWSFINSLPTID